MLSALLSPGEAAAQGTTSPDRPTYYPYRGVPEGDDLDKVLALANKSDSVLILQKRCLVLPSRLGDGHGVICSGLTTMSPLIELELRGTLD